MNKNVGVAGALLNIAAVAAFAVCMPFGFLLGDYLSSIFIAFSFVVLICALVSRGKPGATAAGFAAMIFAGMYAVFILMVYYAQVTTVHQGGLNAQAAALLDYQAFGLFFNYDLLGYCLMALSTFFAGLTIEVAGRKTRALKTLLLVHGVFAVACFIVPLLGLFATGTQGQNWGATVMLELWCAYFIPVGILSYCYLRNS